MKAKPKITILPVTEQHLCSRLQQRAAMHLGVDVSQHAPGEWESFCAHMLALVRSGMDEGPAVCEAEQLVADYVLQGPRRYPDVIRDRAIEIKVM